MNHYELRAVGALWAMTVVLGSGVLMLAAL